MNQGEELPDPRSTTLTRPVGALLLVAVVAIGMLRIRGVPVWDTVWLEDSTIYVTEANVHGPAAVLFRSYAGYLHLVPRLLSLPIATLPVGVLPAYLALAGCVVSAGTAAFVYRSLGGWVVTARVRLAVAALVVIGPALAIENTALITNTIWCAFVILPFALVSTRSGRGDVTARAVIAAVAIASNPLGALYAPLALGVWVVRRTRDSLVVGAAMGLGLVVQLAVVRTGTLAENGGNHVRTVIDMFGVRVLGSFLVGELPLDRLWTNIGEPVVVVFALVTVAIFVVLLRGSAPRERNAALLFLGLAVLCFVVPVVVRGIDQTGFGVGAYVQSWTRYTVAPIVFLATAVAVLVDPPGPSGDRRVASTGRSVFVAQVAIVTLIGLPAWTVRSDGPRWSDEVARTYDTQCVGQPGDTLVDVTASPTNFAATLPCHRLGP